MRVPRRVVHARPDLVLGRPAQLVVHHERVALHQAAVSVRLEPVVLALALVVLARDPVVVHQAAVRRRALDVEAARADAAGHNNAELAAVVPRPKS